jgi:Fe-S-cluster-containing hydrogenase component 2
MKRFNKEELHQNFLAIKNPSVIKRSLDYLGAGGSSCCIQCFDRPCLFFNQTGVRESPPISVCPTDALKPKLGGGVTVGEGCISCGLCVVLCPVGAIEISNDEVAAVSETQPDLVESTSSEKSFLELRNEVKQYAKLSDNQIEVAAKKLAEKSVVLTQKAFYGLTSSLFQCLGMPTFLPPAGDTNNRIDLILIDTHRSLAVEIKSATETRSINVKSIQQALENKIVLDQRRFFESRSSDSSLVVGYSYSPDRSGVEELIGDISNTFGIRIGVISIEDLYRLALRINFNGEIFDRNILTELFGRLV